MKYDQLILISEVCEHYRLEHSFFELLDQHGLLERIYWEDNYYLEIEHLPGAVGICPPIHYNKL